MYLKYKLTVYLVLKRHLNSIERGLDRDAAIAREEKSRSTQSDTFSNLSEN